MANFTQICALQDLLKPAKDEDNARSSEFNSNVLTPGNFRETTLHKNKGDENQSNGIWTDDEVPSYELPTDDLDERIVPEYEILFKQRITSEDIFLGMSCKNPSTSCCENLAAKIYLPDTKYADIQLNITDTYLDCQTPTHKLGLHFPHHVESKNGKAQWDSDKCLLTVTVPLRREYDFLNNTS